MNPALPPVLPQPAAPQSRDAAGLLGVDNQQGPRVARDAETARALRPVDGAGTAADARLPTRRDPPLGPPPAFAINVLQHLRDTALDPPDPATRDAGGEIERPEQATPPARRDDPAPYAATDAQPAQFDIKL